MVGNPDVWESFLLPSEAKPLYQNFATTFPYDTAFFVGFQEFALRSESHRRSKHENRRTGSVISALSVTYKKLGPPSTFLRHFRLFFEKFVSHVNFLKYISQIMVIHTTARLNLLRISK